eukprot:CAMPEP_0170430072 /NCGR_PEP_ID=MMETSP0117_2-20130122/40658_1 /TAXON_ID=400756 /ORGANISM="Durinskia baltica, Strain CSIRO CS-38" /LENGTH=142 /DNA_ID=CAMNT_0010689507 /DNA_START=28 /DNA_END=452 /DNA_ORIENTATION=-
MWCGGPRPRKTARTARQQLVHLQIARPWLLRPFNVFRVRKRVVAHEHLRRMAVLFAAPTVQQRLGAALHLSQLHPADLAGVAVPKDLAVKEAEALARMAGGAEAYKGIAKVAASCLNPGDVDERESAPQPGLVQDFLHLGVR